MGTSCHTILYDNDGKEICVLYRNFDGYPERHGEDLKNFLRGKKIVKGISLDEDENKIFNGMDCLAASIVANFKKEVGNFYLQPAKSRNGQYEYKVKKDLNGIILLIIKDDSGEVLEEWKANG